MKQMRVLCLKHTTAVSCMIQMKASEFLSFWAFYPLYGYKPKTQNVWGIPQF